MEEELLSNTSLSQDSLPSAATMSAFVAKLPFLADEHRKRVNAWGVARFDDFRIVDTQCTAATEAPYCLIGGVFREQPRSLRHLQRLVVVNLKNWGVPRRSYEHGWLRLVSKDEARELLGLKEDAKHMCDQIVRQIVEADLWRQADGAGEQIADDGDPLVDHEHLGDPVEEPARKRARSEDQMLYVMSLQITGVDDCVSRFGFKIGRTSNMESRMCEIMSGLPTGPLMNLVVHAMFPNAGHLERALHKRFQSRLVVADYSREWFRVPLHEIFTAVTELKAEASEPVAPQGV
jgi:hypothetical protein